MTRVPRWSSLPNHGYRSGKILRLKEICDKAWTCARPQVESCVVVSPHRETHGHEGGRDFCGRRVCSRRPIASRGADEERPPVHPHIERQHGEKPKWASCMAPAVICFTPPPPEVRVRPKSMTFSGASADAGWINRSSLPAYGAVVERNDVAHV